MIIKSIDLIMDSLANTSSRAITEQSLRKYLINPLSFEHISLDTLRHMLLNLELPPSTVRIIVQLYFNEMNINASHFQYPPCRIETAVNFADYFESRTLPQYNGMYSPYGKDQFNMTWTILSKNHSRSMNNFRYWFDDFDKKSKQMILEVLKCAPYNRPTYWKLAKYYTCELLQYCQLSPTFNHELVDTDPIAAYYDMMWRFYIHIAIEYKSMFMFMPTKIAYQTELTSWIKLRPYHGTMSIPPFSYNEPTKSAFWFGPPIKSYYGTRGTPFGIATMSTIRERLEYFIGTSGLEFIQSLPHPNHLYIIGSILPACIIRNVPATSWKEYIDTCYVGADVNLVVAGESYSNYRMLLMIMKRTAEAAGAIVHTKMTYDIYYDEDFMHLTNADIPQIMQIYESDPSYVPEIHDRTEYKLISLNDVEPCDQAPVEVIKFRRERIKIVATVEMCIIFPDAVRPIFIYWSALSITNTVGGLDMPCIRGYIKLVGFPPSPHSLSEDYVCHMHPAFINTLMTGCNQECDSSYETVAKYHRRGFGTLMNLTEIQEYDQLYDAPPHASSGDADANVSNNPSMYNWMHDGTPIFSWIDPDLI